MTEGLFDGAEVVICAGSGGVGKTTIAAALGLVAARQGRRVVVITVDPARRLGDALGLPGELGSTPTQIPVPVTVTDTVTVTHSGEGGDRSEREGGPGELWAMMLDPRVTFDRVVGAADDAVLRERISKNRLYNNLADGLSGTQDYLAIEELHHLWVDERFDLVIVDTPPASTALDVVDAPARLVRLFDNRIYQLLTGRVLGPFSVVTKAANRFVRSLAAVIGGDVVNDAVTFFNLVEPLEGGFRRRAESIAELLSSDRARLVLVATPRPDTVGLAIELGDAFEQRGLSPTVAAINMAHPPVPGDEVGEAADRLRRRNLAEHEAGQALLDRHGAMSAAWIPALAVDIADTSGLDHVAIHLGTVT